jgi:hypothetical protein
MLGKIKACASLLINVTQPCSPLCDAVTLKNVWELLDFASMCNAGQLKRACQQFVTLNLSYLVENRSLENASFDAVEELTTYYQSAVSIALS